MKIKIVVLSLALAVVFLIGSCGDLLGGRSVEDTVKGYYTAVNGGTDITVYFSSTDMQNYSTVAGAQAAWLGTNFPNTPYSYTVYAAAQYVSGSTTDQQMTVTETDNAANTRHITFTLKKDVNGDWAITRILHNDTSNVMID